MIINQQYSGSSAPVVMQNGERVSAVQAYSSGCTSMKRGITSLTYIQGIAFGKGKLVLLSKDGAFCTSDGEKGNLPSDVLWFEIGFYNDTFWAIGANGSCAYSRDGVSWYLAHAFQNKDVIYNLMSYNGEIYVALCPDFDSVYCAYRLPGGEWVETTANISNALVTSIAWGNGCFVAVGDGAVALRSTDGVTWQEITDGNSFSKASVAFGNGRFVAIGKDGACVFSADGSSWTSSDHLSGESTNISWSNLVFEGDRFVAVGFSSDDNIARVAVTKDGEKWNVCQGNISGLISLYEATVGDGMIYAVYSQNEYLFFDGKIPALDDVVHYGDTVFLSPGVTNVVRLQNEGEGLI